MDTRRTVITAMLVTAVVFGWSTVMAVTGHTAVLASLAPVLGLTVQQVARAFRTPAAPASGHRAAPVPDTKDGAL
ncbi:hypothetical protein OHA98_19965 [Streptomyces sp. NBC_00654]|uniref:hypothetical protein n=1 Tax=Streptomyces sp. NBC_00654 TaxID=2975799 RepID=UPI002253D51E|nr:hypothetical protein [Streptomyces sp. NBC_00654]MCX4967046.1 hypothetical protein [Streptomyces sp. NBC_00654]